MYSNISELLTVGKGENASLEIPSDTLVVVLFRKSKQKRFLLYVGKPLNFYRLQSEPKAVFKTSIALFFKTNFHHTLDSIKP